MTFDPSDCVTSVLLDDDDGDGDCSMAFGSESAEVGVAGREEGGVAMGRLGG